MSETEEINESDIVRVILYRPNKKHDDNIWIFTNYIHSHANVKEENVNYLTFHVKYTSHYASPLPLDFFMH